MPITGTIYKWCPECHARLTHVSYECDTTGYEMGSCTFGEHGFEEYECEDSGTNDNDNYEYQCPECLHNLYFSNLLNSDPDDIAIEVDETVEPNPPIPETNDGDISNTVRRSENNSHVQIDSPTNRVEVRSIKCPACQHNNLIDEEEDNAILCEKCNNEIMI